MGDVPVKARKGASDGKPPPLSLEADESIPTFGNIRNAALTGGVQILDNDDDIRNTLDSIAPRSDDALVPKTKILNLESEKVIHPRARAAQEDEFHLGLELNRAPSRSDQEFEDDGSLVWEEGDGELPVDPDGSLDEYDSQPGIPLAGL